MPALRRPVPRDEDGMSLVEILVALLLLGLVLSAMVGSIISGLASVQRANGQLGANQLANERMETLRTRDFATVAPTGSLTTATTTEATVTRNNISYTVSWTTTWVDSPCNNAVVSPRDFLRLRVRVVWRNRTGADKTLDVESFRAPTPEDGTSFTPVRTDTLTC